MISVRSSIAVILALSSVGVTLPAAVDQVGMCAPSSIRQFDWVLAILMCPENALGPRGTDATTYVWASGYEDEQYADEVKATNAKEVFGDKALGQRDTDLTSFETPKM